MKLRHRGLVVALVMGVALTVAGCAGSSSSIDDAQPTTSLRYLVNPLDPGQGYVQLGANRYPFDGVICVSGPAKGDPPGRARQFGVYANFTVGGHLAAVSLTRYRSALTGTIKTEPTITDTAMVRMKTDDGVRGLKAQRARVIGQAKWHDLFDPTASTELITRKGDRYEVDARFGPVDVSAATAESDDSAQADTVGQIAARCPAPGTTTTAPGVTPSSTSSAANAVPSSTSPISRTTVRP